MARNFANATDRIQHTNMGSHNPATGTMAFWMRSTAAGNNNMVYSVLGNTSRTGFFFNTYNGATGLLAAQAYPGNSPTGVTMGTSTPVNDGNWHHIAYCWNTALGGNNLLYHNGVLENSMGATRAWSVGNHPRLTGDPQDPFWPTFVGDVAELAEWQATHLTAAEIMSLYKGFSPKLIRRSNLAFYSPLVRDLGNRILVAPGTATGTTVAPHPPMRGGYV